MPAIGDIIMRQQQRRAPVIHTALCRGGRGPVRLGRSSGYTRALTRCLCIRRRMRYWPLYVRNAPLSCHGPFRCCRSLAVHSADAALSSFARR